MEGTKKPLEEEHIALIHGVAVREDQTTHC